VIVFITCIYDCNAHKYSNLYPNITTFYHFFTPDFQLFKRWETSDDKMVRSLNCTATLAAPLNSAATDAKTCRRKLDDSERLRLRQEVKQEQAAFGEKLTK
ncbi:MAG: hypothetical protein LBF67_02910, partial [Prevotellaceae bacterium]|jgi:hypothetical protein|nr:hypothetical protein [Prevotellaceae bacterium]